jgi:calcineurin-like phosphoesterase family protein
VSNWNTIVKPDDDVFYLGDLTFNSIHNTKPVVDRLLGKIHYVMGNHDRYQDIMKYDRWEGVYDILELSVLDEDNLEQRKNKYQHMVLSHYPILQWPRKHYGSIHLHGHSHHALHKSNPEYYENGFVMDVGCNGLDYTPISYLNVKETVKKSNKINGFFSKAWKKWWSKDDEGDRTYRIKMVKILTDEVYEDEE